MDSKTSATPGPWPWEYTGDGKRIVIGAGLVEGPNGYEVAEVYSDDCPQNVAEANARLIASAPNMRAALLKAHTALIAHEAYMTASGYEGPDSSALHPSAAKNWRRVREAIRDVGAAIAKAEG